MKRWTVGFAVVVGLVGVGQVAVGEDIAPPYYRGYPFSTTQEWDFLTEGETWGEADQYYLPADGVSGITSNPYGDSNLVVPMGNINYRPGYRYWQDGIGPGPGGAWFGCVGMTVVIPNVTPYEHDPNPLSRKHVRVQVTYYDPLRLDPVRIDPVKGYSGVNDVLGVRISRQTISLANDWWQLVEDWRIGRLPVEWAPFINREEVYIWGPSDRAEQATIAISGVVIDTLYVPEPSTLALLTMGALALTVGWWRRRRAA